MSSPESKINARIKKALRQMPGFDGHRIELRTGEAGFPDWLIFSGGGITSFVEAKFIYSDADPLKAWTQVQRNWARRKIEKGFNCFVVAGNEESTLLIDAANNLTVVGIPHVRLIWGRSINPVEFGRYLTETPAIKQVLEEL